MICRHCGNEIRESAVFCPYCGEPVSAGPRMNFCVFCGARLQDGAKFCSNCGKTVPPVSGSSRVSGSGSISGNEAPSGREDPRADRPQDPRAGRPQPAPQVPSDPPEKEPRKHTGLIVAAVLILGAAVVLLVTKPWQRTGGAQEAAPAAETSEAENAPAGEEDPGTVDDGSGPRFRSEEEEEDEALRVDPDEYFEQNAAVVEKWNAAESETAKDEASACRDLEDRGFSQDSVKAEYSISGEYAGTQEASPDSPEKHPIYQTNYVNSSGELWTLIVVDDAVIAYPVSYNIQSGAGVQLVISESEEIVSYDSRENAFYRTVPDPSALIVKVVDRIDAAALDRLTVEEIGAL